MDFSKYGLNVSTTPLRQWGFQQCLPLSWTTLRSKHCRHPIAVMGVVDTFGLSPLGHCSSAFCKNMNATSDFISTHCVRMLLLLIGYKWFCVFLSQDTYNISRYILLRSNTNTLVYLQDFFWAWRNFLLGKLTSSSILYITGK